MNNYSVERLVFYDGLDYSIDEKRLTEFSVKLTNRFYLGDDIEFVRVVEEFGPVVTHYSNIQPWGEEIPDIDRRSARIFSVWAEDNNTREIVVTVRGFYITTPFHWGKETVQDYYFLSEDVSYYPITVITSFLTILSDEQHLISLIERVKEEIQKNWHNLRQRIIETMEKTDIWKRYVLSFEKLIHFSFLCSTIDRELADALRKKNFRITGILQMLSSPTPSYDKAMVEIHINNAKRILKKANKKSNRNSEV